MTGNEEELNGSVEEPSSPDGPANLEEAFRALRDQGSGNADGDMGSGDTDQGAGGDANGAETAEVPGAGSGAESSSGTEVSDPIPGEYDGQVGGLADVASVSADNADAGSIGFTSQDYQNIQRTMVESVRRQAVLAANQWLRKEGLEKISVGDLYQRDENTGRTTFRNPDDPSRPFDSRADAQGWVDAYNKQLEAEWSKVANQMQQKFAGDTLPAMRLLAFAPTYDAMNPGVRKVFDTLIDPYAVKDSTGAVVGFSCDLAAAYNQAQKLTETLGMSSAKASAKKTKVPAPASGPALDATTTGTGTSASKSKDPKDLNEAFKMLNEMKKNKNKK